MKLLTLLVISATLVSLLACEGGSTQSDNTAPKSHSHYPTKPAAPVNMRYQLSATPQVGVPLAVEISLTPDVAVAQLQLSYTFDSGLISNVNQNEFMYHDLAAGQTTTQVISITPQIADLSYINVFVSIQPVSGRPALRSFAIPIQTGTTARRHALPADTKIETNEQGESLLINKGSETRTQRR